MLKNIDWIQFEKLIVFLYEQGGYKVEYTGGANPDGGVDLIVYRAEDDFGVVQCKHWRKGKVGIKDIRELRGAMNDMNTELGVFVALSGYTLPAEEYGREKGMLLYEGMDIVMMIEDNPEARGKVAEYLLEEGKICPKCKSEMIIRTYKTGSKVGTKYWGCTRRSPKCGQRFPISDEDHVYLSDKESPTYSPKSVWVPPQKKSYKPRKNTKKRNNDMLDDILDAIGL